MKRGRIVLADDDLLMLAKVRNLLQADFEVVDAVSDGCALIEAAFKWRPDIIVSDISMPKLNGIARNSRFIAHDQIYLPNHAWRTLVSCGGSQGRRRGLYSQDFRAGGIEPSSSGCDGEPGIVRSSLAKLKLY
jgi:hypothetical protein